MKNSGAFKASRPTGRIAAAVRQRPASEIRGNPDDAALKEANQNATQVTPRIAELAEGYVQEILRVVGRRPPQPNKTHFEKNQKERWNRVIEMMRQGRKKKKAMHWDKEDRIQRGSRFVKRVRVEGEIYYVSLCEFLNIQGWTLWLISRFVGWGCCCSSQPLARLLEVEGFA